MLLFETILLVGGAWLALGCLFFLVTAIATGVQPTQSDDRAGLARELEAATALSYERRPAAADQASALEGLA